MKIIVADWMCGPNLKGTKYENPDPKVNGIELEGDINLAFNIARELFDLGRNVKVEKYNSRNIGTRKNPSWTQEYVMVMVDDKTFRQR